MTSRSSRVAALLALASVASAGDLTVGPAGSGADFPEVQEAIDASSPGDRILVAAGTYAPFEVDRPLRILGEGRSAVTIESPLPGGGWRAMRVTGVGAGQEAIVSGMTLRAQTGDDGFCNVFGAPIDGARVDGNAGRVVLHDLAIVPGPDFVPGIVQARPFRALLDIEQSQFVLLDEVRVSTPADGCPTGDAIRTESSAVWITGSEVIQHVVAEVEAVAGGIGLNAIDADVYLARSIIAGGDGGTIIGSCIGGPTFIGTDGDPGIRLSGTATLKAVGGGSSRVTGGNGTFGSGGTTCNGSGAPAVALSGTSIALLADSLPVAGGSWVPSFGTTVMTAPPTEQQGTAKLFASSALYPTLSIDQRAVPIGSPVDFELTGEPFQLAFLFASLATDDPMALPGVIDGAWALDFATQFKIKTALTDATGARTISVQVPADASLEGVVLFLQWIQTDAVIASISNPSGLAIGG